jgi:hypothetical protein
MAVEGQHSRQPARVQRGAPKEIRGGPSGDPNGSRLLPAVMRETMTRSLKVT